MSFARSRAGVGVLVGPSDSDQFPDFLGTDRRLDTAALSEMDCSEGSTSSSVLIMNLPASSLLLEPLLSDPWERLDQIERRIRDEFRHRVHDFRIQAFDDGLVLEGRTKTYYGKQAVTHAVIDATDLPILANRIVVG